METTKDVRNGSYLQQVSRDLESSRYFNKFSSKRRVTENCSSILKKDVECNSHDSRGTSTTENLTSHDSSEFTERGMASIPVDQSTVSVNQVFQK